jgi:urea transport system permease protein
MVEIWQYIIGGVFCVTILFFKGGIVGLFSTMAGKLATRKRSQEAKANVE